MFYFKTMEKKSIKNKRILKGVVKSAKMDKTIVVTVSRTKIHSLYNKRFKVSKNYKVHDEGNKYKDGDEVVFCECRPLSKDKRWRVVDAKIEDKK